MLEIQISEKKLGQYSSSLEQMYGQVCVSVCIDIIETKVRFYGLHSPGLGLEGFEKHQTLLAGYAKVHRLKMTLASLKPFA
jgi:ribosomal protein S12 methylthiotransferase accessory factor